MTPRATDSTNIVHGTTLKPSRSKIATQKINGVNRDIYRANSNGIIYFVNKQSAGTFTYGSGPNVSYNARSNLGHNNTLRHEMGHAFGYIGHASSSTDLMTGNGTSNNTYMYVSDANRNHFFQFRTAYMNGTIAVSLTSISAPSGGYYGNLDAASKDEKYSYIRGGLEFDSNIVIGKPVAITYGDEDSGISQDDCDLIVVDYLFQITDDLTESGLAEYITVRTQMGTVFEIGEEYVISPSHANNTLWDIHIISSFSQFIPRDLLSEGEIDDLRITALNKEKDNSTKRTVVENASLTSEFISSVDVAVEITVVERTKDEAAESIYDVDFELNKFLRGEEHKDLIPDTEWMRINSDVEVGGTYIVLFEVIDGEFVMPSARNGAVISEGTIEFNRYEQAFSSLEQ